MPLNPDTRMHQTLGKLNIVTKPIHNRLGDQQNRTIEFKHSWINVNPQQHHKIQPPEEKTPPKIHIKTSLIDPKFRLKDPPKNKFP